MDVTIAEIIGIIFGIFLLLLSTVLLIGPDRLRGIFLLSTPDLRVYDPTLNKIVNPSKPKSLTVPTSRIPTVPNVPPSMPLRIPITNPSAPSPPSTLPPPTTLPPSPTNQGYLQPNQYAQPPNYPTYSGPISNQGYLQPNQ